MKPEIKAKWVKALRSGRYKQGTGMLYSESNKAFCCLGVLAKSCGILGQRGAEAKSNIIYDNLADPLELTPSTQILLLHMNDVQGKSFNEIADWIEENL